MNNGTPDIIKQCRRCFLTTTTAGASQHGKGVDTSGGVLNFLVVDPKEVLIPGQKTLRSDLCNLIQFCFGNIVSLEVYLNYSIFK